DGLLRVGNNGWSAHGRRRCRIFGGRARGAAGPFLALASAGLAQLGIDASPVKHVAPPTSVTTTSVARCPTPSRRFTSRKKKWVLHGSACAPTRFGSIHRPTFRRL